MMATESHNLPFASWRPRRAIDVVPVQVLRPENQENWWFKFQSEWRRKPMSQLQNSISGREKLNVPDKESEFSPTLPLFYSGLQQIVCNLLTWGLTICFTWSASSKVNLIQKHPWTKPKILTKYLVTLWSSQVDT